MVDTEPINVLQELCSQIAKQSYLLCYNGKIAFHGSYDSTVPVVCPRIASDPNLIPGCRRFYKDCSASKSGSKVCQYGRMVYWRSIDIGYGGDPIVLAVSSDCKSDDGEKAANIPIKLPRRKKKQLKNILKASQERSQHIKRDADVAWMDFVDNYVKLQFESRNLEAIKHDAAHLAHDLLTPINALKASAEKTQSILKADNTHKLSDPISGLVLSSSKIKIIADQIAYVLNPNPAVTQNQFIRKNIGAFIRQIANLHALEASQKHVEIKVEYCDKRVPVIPRQLEMAISNIIGNAVKYSHTGTPDRPHDIRIKFDVTSEYIYIKIQNWGVYLPKEEIENRSIFQRNYRGSNATERGRQGSGLGLHIALKAIKNHNGDIEVASKKKYSEIARTIFTIILPLRNTIE